MSIRVGLISRTFFNMPLWAAFEQGFFIDAGLDIEADILDSGTMVTEGLRDGSLNFAIAPPDGVLLNGVASGTLRIIAGNTSKLSHFLITQPRFKKIEDLKGARIGCLSVDEGTTFVIQDMLSRHGLTFPDDYSLDPVGGAPTRWKLFQEDKIDAGLQSIPLSYMAEDAGFSNLAATTDYIPDYQFTVVNGEGGWMDAHESETVAFLAALLKATEWVHDNRAGVADIAAREMNISVDYAGRAWDDFTRRGIMPRDMSVSPAGLETVAGIMARAGMLPADAAANISSCMESRFLGAARQA